LLNSDTKRHIDAARDVLVGVAPNPTTQIDQITDALIYKFMDDMDQASVKAGGEASFFVGDLEKYAWSNLMSTRMGNQEKMDLYSEALTKFSEAKQLPELFRTIFRAAFLPYRSPETLGLFLKEVSYFDYTHPEELGNAYEYLLSIMSSQGDAGQFRTPRHIIDFIVDVINPTKDDKVLDPACGTGGFLVSTYNHILEQHDGHDDPDKKEKPLTPDERKKLMSNLQGYDIDPTMVRIAQVNMYLHQFKNPQIFQYDSLTSEERWNDKYDVILANPPFMSPKGGIKPHNKFGVSSNRAEVLFVDYIINHLKPKGRAGIVVPEGVVFQTGNAYKALRKNLVDSGLYAVVSLPGGVFQPYSGVKTSILFFDNELAKGKTDIAFVKISADGFDLGATKRAVSQNDLPTALGLLQSWSSGSSVDNSIITFVSKSEISANGDYNLSGDSYKVGTDYSLSKWPMVKLSEISKISAGNSAPQDDESFRDGKYPFFRTSDVGAVHLSTNLVKVNDYLSESGIKGMKLFNKGTILFPKSGASTFLNHRVIMGVDGYVASHLGTININPELALNKFVYFMLTKIDAKSLTADQTYPSLKLEDISKIEIPFPPLEIQEQVVGQLEEYGAIISGARNIFDSWKPRIDVKPSWARVPLKEVCELINGRAYNQDELLASGKYRVLRVGNFFSNSSWYYSDLELDKDKYCEKGDLLYAWSASFGARIWEEEKVIYHYHIWKVINDESRVSRPFLKVLLEQLTSEFKAQGGRGGTMMHLTKSGMEATLVPIPGLDEQAEIVESIEQEQALVDASIRLIDIYSSKSNIVITKLWSVSEGTA
jgi:type I restriction enzyme M protein